MYVCIHTPNSCLYVCIYIWMSNQESSKFHHTLKINALFYLFFYMAVFKTFSIADNNFYKYV